MRQAQAVILPLEFSMSLAQTSSVLGVSKCWVCQLRTEFIHNNGSIEQKPSRGGRYREKLSITEEAEFLSPFIEKAKAGGILIVTEIKEALETRLGRSISDVRRSWCPRPYRPMCQAMVTQEYTYAYTVVSVSDGNMDSLILPMSTQYACKSFWMKLQQGILRIE